MSTGYPNALQETGAFACHAVSSSAPWSLRRKVGDLEGRWRTLFRNSRPLILDVPQERRFAKLFFLWLLIFWGDVAQGLQPLMWGLCLSRKLPASSHLIPREKLVFWLQQLRAITSSCLRSSSAAKRVLQLLIALKPPHLCVSSCHHGAV